ncbi:hypothetical protein HNP52_000801 [Sphingomonas kyeonggiensis]|uniref:Uncharacterized protein n=1 Tax=Sphingomonas kyeonggiensis TaxID=1268553 RepID=A0A7W7JZQ5_9SPHN|nr:hypothetical protein [Sphingomonas kyeonggiensis]MBB4837750.1 hypothetical protein [Sphingomonas kyeonggiensis]
MKRIFILALVASAPALMAQTAAPQGPAGAAPASSPATTAIVFSEKGANGLGDLPMGVHRIPDSNVVISGHQGGIGALFGPIGMLVQSSINAEAGTGKVRNVEDDLRFDVRAKAIEMTNTIMAGDQFRTAFTLTPQPGGRTMTVTPYVVLTFVKKTEDVRPYIVLKTKVAIGDDSGKAIKYFCCEGKALPLAGLTENNGARLKELLTAELDTAINVMLLDRSQPFTRSDEAKVATNGLLPFVGKPLKWRGFTLGRYKDYDLIEFRGGMMVFSGVNIVEPGALEITPVVKK